MSTLLAIKYQEGQLEILDQLLLPLKSQYLRINSVEDAWAAIRSMQVRGAPAIAIVACLSLAVELQNNRISKALSKNDLETEIKKKLDYLVTSRPTAVNLAKEADKVKGLACNLAQDASVDQPAMVMKLVQHIEHLLTCDISDNKAIGSFGASAIVSIAPQAKVRVLTHCNTGSLATAGYGTALGVIRRLWEQNSLEHAYCTETRPYMQGARLTAYELVFEAIPSSLICDSSVAALFNSVKIDAVVVGADRVAANGDTANKIGTYQIAVLAKAHNVAFYVCAPFSSIDFTISSGSDIVIEERPEEELTTIQGNRIAAPKIHCWNPAFDVTPARLITGIITEKGVFKANELPQPAAL